MHRVTAWYINLARNQTCRPMLMWERESTVSRLICCIMCYRYRQASHQHTSIKLLQLFYLMHYTLVESFKRTRETRYGMTRLCNFNIRISVMASLFFLSKITEIISKLLIYWPTGIDGEVNVKTTSIFFIYSLNNFIVWRKREFIRACIPWHNFVKTENCRGIE